MTSCPTPARSRRPARWRAASAVAVAALSLTLSACGGGKDDAAPKPSADAQRVVATVHGAITVPAKPQRVVSLLNSTAVLLDLGITPVGVLTESESEYPGDVWAKVKAIPVVGADETSIDYEKVAALRPDLIVSTQRRQEDFGHAKLQGIAPTVFIVTDTPADTLAALPKIADAAGVADVAAKRQAALDTRLAEIRAGAVPQLASSRWAYAEGGPEGYVANSPVSWPGLFMEKAGLKFSKVAAEQREARGVRLSFEEIGKLSDATAIFYAATPDGKADPATAALMAKPSWKLLPAAAAGKTYPLSFAYSYSYTGINAILDQVTSTLKAQA